MKKLAFALMSVLGLSVVLADVPPPPPADLVLNVDRMKKGVVSIRNKGAWEVPASEALFIALDAKGQSVAKLLSSGKEDFALGYMIIKVPAIKAGETFNYTLANFDKLPSGKYKLSAKADRNNVIKEPNEDNNAGLVDYTKP